MRKIVYPMEIIYNSMKNGWTSLTVKIHDVIMSMSVSCINDGLSALVDRLYYLYPNLERNEYDHNNIEYGSCEGLISIDGKEQTVTWEDVPYKTEIIFDEEGSWYRWNIERPLSREEDFDLILKIEYRSDSEGRDYSFTIRYREMCFAVAKVCTKILKERGLFGYFNSSWDRDINLRRLIFIKAVALNRLQDVKSKDIGNDECASDLNKELEILLVDL